MTDEKRVDPRYDPAFQRGFEGSVTSALRKPPAAVQRSSIVTPAAFRGATAAPEAAPREVEPETEARVTAVASSAPEPAAIPDRRLSRNPFVVALVVLGLGMVAGGAVWANQARMLVGSRGGAATDLDYWFLQATVIGAPGMIVTGLAILAGVLFVAATVWNRRS